MARLPWYKRYALELTLLLLLAVLIFTPILQEFARAASIDRGYNGWLIAWF